MYVLHLIFVLLFSCSFVFAKDGGKKQTIVLNMIVKDESAVIERCLASVKPYIDYWVIVDTGSSDDTKERIFKALQDIPGELHERPWVNFQHNRNEALDLAKGKADYALIIDADEVLEKEANFSLPYLEDDFYYIKTKFLGIEYDRIQLVNLKLPWKWEGVIHEVLICQAAQKFSLLPAIYNIPHTDGARAKDPLKHQKDILLLEEAVKREPQNRRYHFYLALTYTANGDYEKALNAYIKRVEFGGDGDEEIFWSLLQIGKVLELLQKSPIRVIEGYSQAALYSPSRAEPLVFLAKYYRQQERYLEGYQTALKALFLALPKQALFIERAAYDYEALIEFATCAYSLGRYTEAKLASELVLQKEGVPSDTRNNIEQTLRWCNTKLLTK